MTIRLVKRALRRAASMHLGILTPHNASEQGRDKIKQISQHLPGLCSGKGVRDRGSLTLESQ